jgi:hypothetical protein
MTRHIEHTDRRKAEEIIMLAIEKEHRDWGQIGWIGVGALEEAVGESGLAAKYGTPRDFNRLMGYCISNLLHKGRIREQRPVNDEPLYQLENVLDRLSEINDD